MIEPTELAAPPSPVPLPAPLAVLYFLKVTGFVLHVVPMHLWYAGLPLALVVWAAGRRDPDDWPARMIKHMPFFLAFGINGGIVPLLFTQVVYHHVFFPASVLMAWWWFSVVPLLLAGYVTVYWLRARIEHGAEGAAKTLAIGAFAWACLAIIGFLFANLFSLMVRPDLWPSLAVEHSVAAALRGTALNVHDPALWPRWLMMFSLAVLTAAWYPPVSRLVRQQVPTVAERRFALTAYSAGGVAFALLGAWYVFGTWPEHVIRTMGHGPMVILTVATAISPLFPWVVLLLAVRGGVSVRGLLWVGAAGQLLVVLLNAISRQVVQHLELAHFGLIRPQPVAMERWPIVMFVLAAVAGVALVVYMLLSVRAAWQSGQQVDSAC